MGGRRRLRARVATPSTWPTACPAASKSLSVQGGAYMRHESATTATATMRLLHADRRSRAVAGDVL